MSKREELVAIIDHAYTTKDWTGPRSTAEVIADAVLAAGYWQAWDIPPIDPFLQTADFGDDE